MVHGSHQVSIPSLQSVCVSCVWSRRRYNIFATKRIMGTNTWGEFHKILNGSTLKKSVDEKSSSYVTYLTLPRLEQAPCLPHPLCWSTFCQPYQLSTTGGLMVLYILIAHYCMLHACKTIIVLVLTTHIKMCKMCNMVDVHTTIWLHINNQPSPQ